MSARILIVDDDPSLRRSLQRALVFEGYVVDTADGGPEAMRYLAANVPDAIILDVLMADLDGIEVCHRLRAVHDQTPILMLTALDSVADRVAGLDAGADDYLAKPFALDELLARVRALVRRTQDEHEDDLRFADLTVAPRTREVRRGQRELMLTRTEFELLELFVRHPRQVLRRHTIIEHVWAYDMDPASNLLDVYIGYLRRKMEAAGEPRLLQTARGVGYALREP